jgi:hypothetical protein
MGDVDEPKTMAGHQATKRTAICCVPNAAGVIWSLIKSMTVLNEARASMKKKDLRATKWAFVMAGYKRENTTHSWKTTIDKIAG